MLTNRRRFFSVLALSVLAATPVPALATIAGQARTLTLRTRILLQFTMQSFIEEHSVNGVFSFTDPETDLETELFPQTMHTFIIDTGTRYVLCYDFRTRSGQDVDLDFYIAPTDRVFAVEEVRKNQRSGLLGLIEEGRAWLTN